MGRGKGERRERGVGAGREEGGEKEGKESKGKKYM